jgi:hypothetical protein
MCLLPCPPIHKDTSRQELLLSTQASAYGYIGTKCRLQTSKRIWIYRNKVQAKNHAQRTHTRSRTGTCTRALPPHTCVRRAFLWGTGAGFSFFGLCGGRGLRLGPYTRWPGFRWSRGFSLSCSSLSSLHSKASVSQSLSATQSALIWQWLKLHAQQPLLPALTQKHWYHTVNIDVAAG